MSHPDCTVQVICQGRRHRIRHTARGHLVLCDHDLQTEAVLLALGGEPCRCLQFLACWQGALHVPPAQIRFLDAARSSRWLTLPTTWLPKGLRPLLRRAERVQHDRWQRRHQSSRDASAQEPADVTP